MSKNDSSKTLDNPTPQTARYITKVTPPRPISRSSVFLICQIQRPSSARLATTSSPLLTISTPCPLAPLSHPWTSLPAFSNIFGPEINDTTIYQQSIAPAIPQVLAGSDYNIFAYGNNGSGKPHLIDSQNNENRIGTGFSIFELRKNTAFYLSSGRNKCFIREDSDKKTRLRGKTEVLDGGKLRVQGLAQIACWTFESMKEELQKSLGRCSVGSSSVHDQSSRMHAILKLEIMNRQLIEAQNVLIEREAESVPVGK
ncbi:putative kinesin motor domain-containing protein [Botrytis fragariae]|uniref:Putative kinesin motor domain-containing protein n=1 Tax=Botrytis fragariae TaxID=1964551 RepID=A0A8H6AL81_9HELO|nr:putative kinesin motor domain-containing protein [Botrytis fragariae]KAF5869315.1 putative kinesin motor domain-containing protein [Botrytis fragariae]